MKEIMQYLPLVSVVVTIGSLLGAFFYVYKHVIPRHSKELEDKDERLKALEDEIKNMDCVSGKQCIDSQAACQERICGKIDVLRNELKEMDKKREDAKKEHSEKWDQITYHMGKVDQWMQDHSEIG